MIYAIALFGFRIFDPLPVAGRAAIEQMQEGMVVFDAGWRALSLNPAAAGILGVLAAGARGKTWAELLPSYPDPEQCLGSGTMPVEVSLGGDEAARAHARARALLEESQALFQQMGIPSYAGMVLERLRALSGEA